MVSLAKSEPWPPFRPRLGEATWKGSAANRWERLVRCGRSRSSIVHCSEIRFRVPLLRALAATGFDDMRSSFVCAAAFAMLSTAGWGETAAPDVATGTSTNQIVFTKLSDAAIAQFKANPQSLLSTYASAGLPLSTQVRSLLLTD